MEHYYLLKAAKNASEKAKKARRPLMESVEREN